MEKKSHPIVRANPQPIPVGFSHRAARRPVNGLRAILEAEIDPKTCALHDLTGLPGCQACCCSRPSRSTWRRGLPCEDGIRLTGWGEHPDEYPHKHRAERDGHGSEGHSCEVEHGHCLGWPPNLSFGPFDRRDCVSTLTFRERKIAPAAWFSRAMQALVMGKQPARKRKCPAEAGQ
jgi:hypothetical protein